MKHEHPGLIFNVANDPLHPAHARLARSIARLVAIAAGSYPLGIGIAYLIEAARLWFRG